MMQTKIQALLAQLANINSQDKNIIVYFSTSQYEMFNKQTLEFYESSICYQKVNLIIFSSHSKKNQLFFEKLIQNIYVSNNVKKIRQILDQNDINQQEKRKIFVYISSSNNLSLDNFSFLESTTMFLRKYIGKIILEMHPIYKEKFDQKFKNLKKYFHSLYNSSHVIELNQEPKDYYFVYSLKSKLTLYPSHPSFINLSQEREFKSQIKRINNIFQNNQKNQLRMDNFLFVTGNVMECFEKHKKFFQFDEKQQKIQKQYKQIAKEIRTWMNFGFEHPDLQNILFIYQKYGIILCELKSLFIFKKKLQEEGFQNLDLQDQNFTSNYEDLQNSLKKYIIDHYKSFPIIITDCPHQFLEEGQLSFKYVEIEANFYDILNIYSDSPEIQFKKIITRRNNSDNANRFIFSFMDQKTFQLFKELQKKLQIKQDKIILQYPLNLEQRFTKYNKKNQKKIKQKQNEETRLDQTIITKNKDLDETTISHLQKTCVLTRNQIPKSKDIDETIIISNSNANLPFNNILPDDLLKNNNQKTIQDQSPQSVIYKFIRCDIQGQYNSEDLFELLKRYQGESNLFYSQMKDFLFNKLNKNWAFILKISPELQNKARQKILLRVKQIDKCWKTDFQSKLKSIQEIQLLQILKYFHEQLGQLKKISNDIKKNQLYQNYSRYFKKKAQEKKYCCKDFKSFLSYCFTFENLYKKFTFQSPRNDMSSTQEELLDEFINNVKKANLFGDKKQFVKKNKEF